MSWCQCPPPCWCRSFVQLQLQAVWFGSFQSVHFGVKKAGGGVCGVWCICVFIHCVADLWCLQAVIFTLTVVCKVVYPSLFIHVEQKIQSSVLCERWLWHRWKGAFNMTGSDFGDGGGGGDSCSAISCTGWKKKLILNALSLSVERLIQTLMTVWVCSGLCYFWLYCMDFVFSHWNKQGGMTECNTLKVPSSPWQHFCRYKQLVITAAVSVSLVNQA